MNQLLPQEIVDLLVREERHFAGAPDAFLQAWKRGAEIAGPEWLGDGSREGLRRATDKFDLRPNMLMLNDALGVLSSGQRMFLSAMVSFYNAREGAAMLRRCGFEGLADLGGLDLERRQVIADLVLNYSGWQATPADLRILFSPLRGTFVPSGRCPSFFSQELHHVPNSLFCGRTRRWPGPSHRRTGLATPPSPEAICRGDTPTVFESLPDALSPRSVLTELGESIADEMPGPLALTRSVRQDIVDLDARLNAVEQAPTGDDYNQLYILANCGLIEVQKALGDTNDFGD